MQQGTARGDQRRLVELAPPFTETPLYFADFKERMKGQSGMAVDTLVRRFIAGAEQGRTEIRPGQSAILKIAGRVAPEFIFKQMSKVR